MTSVSSDSGSHDVEVDVKEAGESEKQPHSIYDVRSTRQRWAILCVVSFASILLPFSDTIYLPALSSLVEDLHTTEALGAASVAVYMFAVGLTALLWGPFSDRFGRRLTFWLCASSFLATTIVCIFAPSIEVLMAFRALQGCAVTGYMVAGNAVVADVFPPAQRGQAAGVFMIPTLVGPILGPLIGGALSEAFGWRSCFVALAIFAAVALVAKLLVLRQETHQYYTLEYIRTKLGRLAADAVVEASSISRPVFHAPWQPLRLVCERSIAPHGAAALLNFAAMFASLMVLPLILGAPPYNLSPAIIGVAYLPVGVGGFITSPLAGRVADVAARRLEGFAEGRLVPATLVAMGLMPASLLTFGWTLHFTTSLAGPLIAHFFVGVALSMYFPAIFSYLTVVKQQQAGAAAAAIQALMFILSGVFIMISIPIEEALGMGPFMTILAGLVLAAFGGSAYIILTKLRRCKDERAVNQQQL